MQFFPKNGLTAKHGKEFLKKINNCSILFFSGHFIIRRSLYICALLLFKCCVLYHSKQFNLFLI